MKADEAPEKIYLTTFGFPISDTVWSKKPYTGADGVEYIRKDAFIKKACDWVEPVLKDYAGYYGGTDILEDFKKYLEGE